MKATLSLAVLSLVLFSNIALAENDTYCGRYPHSAACANHYVAPPDFQIAEEAYDEPAFTPVASTPVSAVVAAPAATAAISAPVAVIPEDSSPAVSAPEFSEPAPVSVQATAPVTALSNSDVLNAVAAPTLALSNPTADEGTDDIAAPQDVSAASSEPAVSAPTTASPETTSYCSKYPDSPVCMKPSTNKSFCEQWPSNPACSSLKKNSQPATQPAESVSVSSQPVVPAARPLDQAIKTLPGANIPNMDADILLITDQPGAASASAIKEKLATMAPFSCMNLKVEIFEVSKDELGCNPRVDSSRPRLLECDAKARTRANKIRNKLNAKTAIVVVNFDQHAGAGWSRTPLVSSFSPAGAGIHEMLHGVGFSDEYTEGNQYTTGGTIMHALDGNIPQPWWPKISRYFDKSTPTSCR